MDQVLTYMYLMFKKMVDNNRSLKRDYLNAMGKEIGLFPGVNTWFQRINDYGKSRGMIIEHYIISSGLKEIIEGTKIGNEFKEIYASEFFYNEDGNAMWPKIAVNYTNKTQFLNRINKGVLDISDDNGLNKKMLDHDRRISHANMIYIGDGLTDIPCMKLIREKGGRAIALYPSGQRDKVIQLVQDNRINTVCVSDYSKDSTLEKLVKLMVENMALINVLNSKEERQLAQTRKLVQDNYEN